MKLLIPIALALVLFVAGFYVASGSSEPAAAEAGAGTGAAAMPRAPEAGGAAELLAQVGRAYRAAPALTDTVTIRYQTQRGEQVFIDEVALGSGREARLTVSGYRLTAADEKLYLTLANSDHKYVAVPLGNDPVAAYGQLTSGGILPMHLALRWTEDTAGHLSAMTLGQVEKPRLLPSYGLVKNGRGQEVHELTIEGDNGQARVRVDPERNLVTDSTLSYTLTRGQGQRSVEMQVTYDPKITQQLETAIGFPTEGRVMVTSLDSLKRTAVGEPAADFTLLTPEGETFRMSELRGQVVVLDFWATWCPPCRRSLPLLQEVHDWAVQEKQPVRVFAVNVWERLPDNEAKKKAVIDYWKREGYTMKALMDLDGSAVQPYGFSSIPHTVVIGPDGRVAAVHQGFLPSMASMLKDEAKKLLGLLGE